MHKFLVHLQTELYAHSIPWRDYRKFHAGIHGPVYTDLLSDPFVRTSIGVRGFSVAAPKTGNSLPPALRVWAGPDTFRRHLKSPIFPAAFQHT